MRGQSVCTYVRDIFQAVQKPAKRTYGRIAATDAPPGRPP